ncbi:hypothetical protein KSS87_011299 [Heliosperma pusillum]|nr:hypothetical protein KSS87_011299 [Heliosperma pusillum]
MATLMSTLSFTPLTPVKTQLPNKFPSQQAPLSLSFSLRHNIKQLVCKPVPRCSFENRDSYEQMGAYPKPSEIQWKKELSNSVQLIGTVGLPVQITHLSSGKVVASTRLAVWKSATETSWINLTFWDDLARIAHQHVEKGNQIYVSGRLLSDTVESEDGKQQIYYKVVVQQLNFVEKSPPSPVSSYDESYSSASTAAKFNNSAAPAKLSTQELWQAFFANPTEWWDNRNKKTNPKYPDFKHKDTGEALWVEGRYNPTWVKSQLEILDSRMQSRQNQDEPASLNLGYDQKLKMYFKPCFELKKGPLKQLSEFSKQELQNFLSMGSVLAFLGQVLLDEILLEKELHLVPHFQYRVESHESWVLSTFPPNAPEIWHESSDHNVPENLAFGF